MNNYSGSLADFNQYIRFIKYLAIYLLASIVIRACNKKELYDLLVFTLRVGMILVLIALSQYFDFLNMNSSYVHIIAPTQYETLVDGYRHPRPVGMIGNPNELGFLMALLSLLTLHCIHHFSKTGLYFYFIIFFIGLLLTMSRSSIVAYVAGILTFYGWIILRSNITKKLKALFAFFALSTIIAYTVIHPVVYEAITWRLARVFDLATDASTQVRFIRWEENIAIIKEHPILGVGPLRRADLQYAADNEWLLIWRSYGLFGLIFTIGFFLRELINKKKPAIKALHLSLIASSFVYMIPAAIFHSLVLFPFILFLFALIDQPRQVRMH